ncbi:carbon-nitrogen hydrolase family protein [Rhizorhapis suberifaciens]|uniref:Putative amidohydrolase n=1 Tax=Rhizorhapis suberifaciens TaxID=13656 RepID=A0A840HZQ3_9SPHN|nr:carbon-nitrogen hydrolase family protein [Rhizorhapis suberifaciens]MBB4642934.1 putative amidohydrolase [Rhizorhapis suberifaciens]
MRAAILQMTSGTDPARNAAVIAKAVARAGEEGGDMLFTPEMAGQLDRDRSRAAVSLTNEAGSRVLAEVRNAAAKAGVWVHLGSLALKGEREDGRWSNRSFVIDDCGEVRARYDKIHLFDVDLATGETWRESSVYGSGERVVAVDTPWARLGLSICYDIRFPDLYRALSDAGANILLVPSAFTVPTGRAHWHVLLRARAIEAGCFLIAPAQTGRHEDGRETFGHSCAIDPWGDILLDMGTETGLALADIEMERVAEVRSRIPAIANRRAIASEVDIA